ncbi:anaerobic sulfatase maturase [Neobacillus niacini]|uniref:anaerobic sulfatase maturase n=1 Tax=Neobacillus niacini TaxID=86668 RepID=UPI0021CB08F0|nr:anaerobic sulfatase maturase [Neobacillus niacini]MCM3763897.1 anaerobic sulfatase maturase [Neobacillus niacini]
MQTLSILIKPASSSCNLDCNYCFYHNVANHRMISSYGIMKEDVQTALIEKAFESGARLISFAFQGGEPTLAGLEFYHHFVENVHVYNTKNAAVSYSIQTNGYGLDEEWVKFFKENDFLVGVSVDGPSHIHDEQRKTNHQRPTHQRIMETIRLLQLYGVPFNILCVLSKYVAEHIHEVYEFFMNEGFHYIQFIPCLNQMDETNAVDSYALSIEQYRNTLNTLFDLYKENFDQGHYISDRLFDNYVRMSQGFAPESCSMTGSCTTYFVIEANGDVFPCDFYALDAYKLGNITESGYDEMYHGRVASVFRSESVPLSDKCKSCKHLALCRGGCKRYKVQNKKSNEFELYYCDANYDFFERNTAAIVEIGKKVLQGYLV